MPGFRGEGSYTFRYASCHHQNDFCIKIGSGVSHFNAALTVRGKVILFINHNFGRARKTEAESNRGASAYQANILPLGQTGSHGSKQGLGKTAKSSLAKSYSPMVLPGTHNMLNTRTRIDHKV